MSLGSLWPPSRSATGRSWFVKPSLAPSVPERCSIQVSGALDMIYSISANWRLNIAMTTVATWFDKRRAFAIGVAMSGSSIGGVVFPIMMNNLIEKIGYPWAMRVAALTMLAMLIFANFTVSPRVSPKRPTQRWHARDSFRPLEEPPTLLIIVGGFFYFFGMFLPYDFVFVQALQDGVPRSLAKYLVSIVGAAGFFGRIFPAWCGDRFGRFNLNCLMMLCSAVSVFALWMPYPTDLVRIFLFAAVFGFFSGAVVVLCPAVLAQVCDIGEFPTRLGLMYAINSIGVLVGNPVGGAIYERTGAYMGLQIYTGALLVMGTFFLLAARVHVGGWQLIKV
jgi:predicted MFS family arabinose efflux permease